VLKLGYLDSNQEQKNQNLPCCQLHHTPQDRAEAWPTDHSNLPVERPKTPPILSFLATWKLDPVALVASVIAGALYLTGVVKLARRGEQWPRLRTLAFFVLGLGSFLVVTCGFLGAYSVELRWAFTTRIALLLFAVPGLISVGLPITLAKRVLSGLPERMLNAILRSWPVRLIGNAVFAPLFALVAFSVFLTPLAGAIRLSVPGELILTAAVPLVGLLMVLPIVEHTAQRTSFFISVEFLLVFVELLADAIPGILLRLNDAILDRVPPVLGILPTWFPSRYHDQHLSGDLLWFIAEISDIPILILLFIRWSRVDRHEAKELDELSDEEMDALTADHLRSRRT
jgi:putative membrane protein